MLNDLRYTPIEEARSSKRLFNFVLVFFIGFLFMMLGEIGGMFANMLPDVLTLKMSGMLALSFGFTTLITFLWVEKVEGRKFASIGLKKEGALAGYAKGMLVGIIMYSGVMVFLYLTGNAKIVGTTAIKTGVAALPSVLILIPGWIIQTGTEEIVGRGWIMSSIGAKYNNLFAVIFSSVFFSLIHIFNPGITTLAIINIFLVGVFFALMSLYYDNIWAACGLHFTWNLFQGNVFGCPVSGNVIGGASVVSTDLVGSEILTGGKFGPEAGIVATAVIVIAIVYYWMKLKNK